MKDIITKTPTIKPDGLSTRWGGKIVKVHGIGSGPQDRPLPDTWWIIVDVYYEDEDVTSEKREYHPSQIVHDDDKGIDNFDAISKALMYHLRTHGTWDKKGDWKQVKLKAV